MGHPIDASADAKNPDECKKPPYIRPGDSIQPCGGTRSIGRIHVLDDMLREQVAVVREQLPHEKPAQTPLANEVDVKRL